MDQSVGIVVPAFRPDVDRLGSYVRTLDEQLAPAQIRIELDDPEPGVTEGLASLPAAVNAVPYRRGKGAAITAGFEAIETDVRAFADADGSTDAASLARVIDRVRAGEADLAVGSRRHPDATVSSHQTFARRFLGDGFAWIAGHLLDVSLHDYQCGAKAITAEGWEHVRTHLYDAGFAWDVELVAIAGALGLTVAEVPIEWEDRPGSTVSPVRTSLNMATALLRARHRAKRLSDSRLHAAIAATREKGPALIDNDE
ncbi:glycosyltransferase [Halomicrobium katesii]|uniref:glycosyltransferase n=1 Tax=Halomicrobium katesii TaxID=437163 RepID=UPI000381DF08|nr:glycosyltransferase [Halomicrobium katesii]